jgi:hypothetical protein
MIYARRLIGFISVAVGLWMLISFAAVMLGAPHTAFWTSSLMWALLASMLLFPALLMAWLGSDRPAGLSRPTHERDGSPDRPRPEPFADEPSSLWPEPQEPPRDEWPYNREDMRPRRTETQRNAE